MNRKTEKEVRRSFADATPNNLETIRSDCPARATATRTASTSSVRGWKWATCAMAIVLVVALVCTGVVLGVGGKQTAVAATVTLDVNPSVEIKLGKTQRVVDVTALNSDGVAIIGDMKFNGCTLDVAVYALIGSMVTQGYFSMSNSVLVSVDSDSQSMYDELVGYVTEKVTVTLHDRQVQASVLSQWIQDNDVAKDISRTYGISVGKAQLITKILNNAAEGAYNAEQLAKLSVNDLNLILESLNLDDDVLTHSGEQASQSNYIGRDAAIAAALAFLDPSLTESDVERISCKMDFEGGVMVYEIEFVYNGWEYEIEVNARNGVIFKHEYEREHHIPNPDKGELTEEQIREIIYEMLNIPQNDRKWIQIGYDPEDKEYFAKFNYNDTYYEIEFDLSGKILSFESTPNPDSGGWEVDSDRKTEEEIKRLAFDSVNVPEQDRASIVVKCEFDRKDDEYEVEFLYGATKYELKFYADGTLKYICEENVQVPPELKPGSQTSNDDVIQAVLEQIKNIYGNIDVGIVFDLNVEPDTENGRAVFEVEFKYRDGGKVYEVECDLDAFTLEILRCTREIEN